MQIYMSMYNGILAWAHTLGGWETKGSSNETGGFSSEIGECAPHSEVAL